MFHLTQNKMLHLKKLNLGQFLIEQHLFKIRWKTSVRESFGILEMKHFV